MRNIAVIAAERERLFPAGSLNFMELDKAPLKKQNVKSRTKVRSQPARGSTCVNYFEVDDHSDLEDQNSSGDGQDSRSEYEPDNDDDDESDDSMCSLESGSDF